LKNYIPLFIYALEQNVICVKGYNPLNIQQNGITPVSTCTVLKAATGTATRYMVNVVVVWV